MRRHSSRFILLAGIWSVLRHPHPSHAQQLSCENCRGGNLKCIGDSTLQSITDEECEGCLKSGMHWTWPCSVEGLCWCWDSTKPRYKPPPPSDVPEAEAMPCDVFTQEMFDVIAPNAVHPYNYSGLCDVIDEINSRYDEKVFKMGSIEQQKAEWAAFVGHTTHESAQYTAAREALQCARTYDMPQGTFCKPCANENFDWGDRVCQVSLVANGQFYEEYCDKIVTPPYGCVCGPTTEVDDEDLKGLINPNFAYFGRGAIQLSWNANYLGASQVLAESADVLCSQPDLVATDPKYAWGTAIWFWLFKNGPEAGTTCHIQSLGGSFGGSLNIINGGLECPPDPAGYHAEAIVTRLRYYCIAASVIGVKSLLNFDGCDGLGDAFHNCILVRATRFTGPGRELLFDP
jgi:predicted chitinase